MVSLPTLSPADKALFEAYLRHGVSIEHLAAAVEDPTFSTLDALQWLNLPHITAARRAYRAALAEAAAIRLARARITAIETLDSLCTARIDISDRRRAATTIMTASRSHKRAATPTKPTTPHTPKPTPTTPAAPTSTAPPAPLPAASASDLSDQSDLCDLTPPPLSQADDDLQDAIHDCMDDLLDDEELDREADEIEARLGVPLSHPEILKAISEGRIDELDAIAATIRATG